MSALSVLIHPAGVNILVLRSALVQLSVLGNPVLLGDLIRPDDIVTIDGLVHLAVIVVVGVLVRLVAFSVVDAPVRLAVLTAFDVRGPHRAHLLIGVLVRVDVLLPPGALHLGLLSTSDQDMLRHLRHAPVPLCGKEKGWIQLRVRVRAPSLPFPLVEVRAAIASRIGERLGAVESTTHR
jgi:hypothetical protein